MKVYKIQSGVIIEKDKKYYQLEVENWDTFINDDNIIENINGRLSSINRIKNASEILELELQAPIYSQEIWASGVTYYNSKLGREEESKTSGGAGYYAKVYVAERPELFFKANAYRTVGHGGVVRIRKDSEWNVPEPELTLAITSSGKIIGYTIGNDMSSRSIEGENPLYLPQAKSYDGCAAIGPCILLSDDPISVETKIHLNIFRNGNNVFNDNIGVDQIKRKFEDLVSYLYLECSFPHGSLLMTGTGIVPSSDFSLKKDDEIHISIDGIGTLINKVG
ncbi:MAG: 2-dehydro-3-deoxy-D-arabinonate dehydratase [Saprospiraceae bacterium]|jgi:2-dehydro-3-deoxy-D-arabinonate dehydratase